MCDEQIMAGQIGSSVTMEDLEAVLDHDATLGTVSSPSRQSPTNDGRITSQVTLSHAINNLTEEERCSGKCSTCGIVFDTEGGQGASVALFRHIKYYHHTVKHNERFEFTSCKMCTESFPNTNFDSAFYSHMNSVHSLDPTFTCFQGCDGEFHVEEDRVTHEFTHGKKSIESNKVNMVVPIPRQHDHDEPAPEAFLDKILMSPVTDRSNPTDNGNGALTDNPQKVHKSQSENEFHEGAADLANFNHSEIMEGSHPHVEINDPVEPTVAGTMALDNDIHRTEVGVTTDTEPDFLNFPEDEDVFALELDSTIVDNETQIISCTEQTEQVHHDSQAQGQIVCSLDPNHDPTFPLVEVEPHELTTIAEYFQPGEVIHVIEDPTGFNWEELAQPQAELDGATIKLVEVGLIDEPTPIVKMTDIKNQPNSSGISPLLSMAEGTLRMSVSIPVQSLSIEQRLALTTKRGEICDKIKRLVETELGLVGPGSDPVSRPVLDTALNTASTECQPRRQGRSKKGSNRPANPVPVPEPQAKNVLPLKNPRGKKLATRETVPPPEPQVTARVPPKKPHGKKLPTRETNPVPTPEPQVTARVPPKKPRGKKLPTREANPVPTPAPEPQVAIRVPPKKPYGRGKKLPHTETILVPSAVLEKTRSRKIVTPKRFAPASPEKRKRLKGTSMNQEPVASDNVPKKGRRGRKRKSALESELLPKQLWRWNTVIQPTNEMLVKIRKTELRLRIVPLPDQAPEPTVTTETQSGILDCHTVPAKAEPKAAEIESPTAMDTIEEKDPAAALFEELNELDDMDFESVMTQEDLPKTDELETKKTDEEPNIFAAALANAWGESSTETKTEPEVLLAQEMIQGDQPMSTDEPQPTARDTNLDSKPILESSDPETVLVQVDPKFTTDSVLETLIDHDTEIQDQNPNPDSVQVLKLELDQIQNGLTGTEDGVDIGDRAVVAMETEPVATPMSTVLSPTDVSTELSNSDVKIEEVAAVLTTSSEIVGTSKFDSGSVPTTVEVSKGRLSREEIVEMRGRLKAPVRLGRTGSVVRNGNFGLEPAPGKVSSKLPFRTSLRLKSLK